MFIFIIIIILEVGYIIVQSTLMLKVKKQTFILTVVVSELRGCSNKHLKCLSCHKSQKKKTGSSEELCVYLTMAFSKKRKKGLLIVLSVSLRLSVFVLI